MNAAEKSLHKPPSRRFRSPSLWIAAFLIAICTTAFHIHSYWWSEELTLCDVTLTADEGLVSLNVPLTRIAAKESPRSGFLLYERGLGGWTTTVGAEKALFRRVMKMPEFVGANGEYGAMFADFGYWKGGWQSKSRPGPFVVLFVPTWLVGVAVFGVYVAFHLKIVRFRFRTLLIAITLAAGLLWLLTLRAPT
jgi:hypothetical protein